LSAPIFSRALSRGHFSIAQSHNLFHHAFKNPAGVEMRTDIRMLAFSFVFFLILAPAPSSAQFEIKEWPHNLRTDLKGSKIKIALPENEPDRPWNDALLARFRRLTGIEVETIRPGNDTTVVLATYLREFASGAPRADVEKQSRSPGTRKISH